MEGVPVINDHQFVWILWYIWKEQNNKVFSNIDIDPRDILKFAKTESLLWAEAHTSATGRIAQLLEIEEISLPSIPGHLCFTDGSWKEKYLFSGQGWYNTLPGFEGLIGARNTRASLSPLHSEMETFIWAMKSMRNLRQYNVTFATDCIQLATMVSAPEEWLAFANYLDDIKIL